MFAFINRVWETFHKKKRQHYIKNLKRNGLVIGQNVEIVDTFFFDPSHCYLIKIGNNVTICPGVRLIAHDASTKNFLGYTKLGKIEIKDNCFIGDSTIILPGVVVGPNAIVGAGSVVTKNVKPNTISAGNPAETIYSLDAYLGKIRKIASQKRVFNEDYLIRNLDENKRFEILNNTEEGIAFIV